MRRARQRAAGLAGMAAVREVPGLRLLRPLLAVRKLGCGPPWRRRGGPGSRTRPIAATHSPRGRLRADPAFAPEVPWAEGVARAEARSAEDERVAARARPARPAAPAGLRPARCAGSGARLSRRRAAVLGRLLATIGGRPYPVAAPRSAGGGARRHCRRPSAAASSCAARDDLVDLPRAGTHSAPAALCPGRARCGTGALRSVTRAGRASRCAHSGRRARSRWSAGSVTGCAACRAGPLCCTAYRGLGRRDAGACPTLDQSGLRPRAGFSITQCCDPPCRWPRRRCGR